MAEYAQEQGEDAFAELLALRAAAWAKIQAGQGEMLFLQSTSMNGKSTTISSQMTCAQVFTMTHEAIRAYRGQNYRSTEADFSALTDL